MSNAIDLTGQKFGRLVVIEPISEKWNGGIVNRCLCDCGKQCFVRSSELKRGSTKSCGCLLRELVAKRTIKRNTKHGYRYHPLYSIWKGIIARCENKYHRTFEYYGGRNIQICNEWRNDAKAFIEWALINGWKKGLTIERQNNDGPYNSENCCFATRLEQADNTRNLCWFFAFNEKTGEFDEDNNQMEFSRRHNLGSNRNISACLRGKQKNPQGLDFPMAPKLRKDLKKFKGIAQNQRPLIIDPDLVNLFRDLGERSDKAIVLSIIVQRIAHIAAGTKSLDLSTQEFFDLFPFIDSRHLRKCLYLLREYGIWKNKPYRPRTKTAAYTNIRISWKSVARLAKQIQDKKGGTKCYK